MVPSDGPEERTYTGVQDWRTRNLTGSEYIAVSCFGQGETKRLSHSGMRYLPHQYQNYL